MRKSITLLLLVMCLGIGGAMKGQLMITEIMYNSPASRPSLYPDSAQFIEIRNVSGTAINMAGYALSGAINHSFLGFTVQPGEHFAVIKNGPGFQRYFGISMQLDVWTSGNLDTVSGTILLKNPSGITIDSVFYSNAGPAGGNNDGHSITYCQNTMDNADPAAWVGANTLIPGAVSHGIQIFANPGACCLYGDVTGPTLISGGALDLSHIGLKFSEPVATYSFSNANFTGISNIGSISHGATKDSVILTLSVPMADGIFDSVHVSGVQDTACNTMGASQSIEVVYNSLVKRFEVVEIYYKGPGSPVDSLQYVEWANIESTPIQIGGYRVGNGAISYGPFREQILQPNERVVLAAYPDVVERVFHTTNVLPWDGGGSLALSSHIETWNSDGIIDSLTYASVSDWPNLTPDSANRSIVICNILANNIVWTFWKFSADPGDFGSVYMGDSVWGSPGRSNCNLVGVTDPLLMQTKVYPNPFTASFEVETASQLIVEARVMDAMGRLVKSESIRNGYAKVDLGGAGKGMYFVNLLSEDGQILQVRKLVRL